MQYSSATRPQIFSLLQFCSEFRHLVDSAQFGAWVTAEVGQVSSAYGRYYLDLIEKHSVSHALVAKLRCIIWEHQYHSVVAPFVQSTGSDIAVGMQLLVFVRLTFHEAYGLSGQIISIDPSFTLGELEARRRAVIAQLQSDGVVDMNKSLSLPRVIKRIAVVSSGSAAGYGDFCHQLNLQAGLVGYHLELFDSLMQGQAAAHSIITALDQIARRQGDFDVVVIIRGGGARMDLVCFDEYELAANVAQFPLPILAGIGHERDHSVVDMVSHTSLKTPTAVAEFVIDLNSDFLLSLQSYVMRLRTALMLPLTRERNRCDSLAQRAQMSLALRIRDAQYTLNGQQNRLLASITAYITSQKFRLENLSVRLDSIDPRQVLARGFSMTTDSDGMPLTDVSQLAEGTQINTYLSSGHIVSTVQKVSDFK